MNRLYDLANRLFGPTWIFGLANDGLGNRVAILYYGRRHYEGVGQTSDEAEADLCARLVAEVVS